MPKFKAPEHVSSVSIAGTEYKVENGFVEAPIEVHVQISPLGFTLSSESQNDSDTDEALRKAADDKAERDAKRRQKQKPRSRQQLKKRHVSKLRKKPRSRQQLKAILHHLQIRNNAYGTDYT